MELYEDTVRGGAGERKQTAVCPEGLQAIITGGLILVYLTAKPPESSTPTRLLPSTCCFCVRQRGDTC